MSKTTAGICINPIFCMLNQGLLNNQYVSYFFRRDNTGTGLGSYFHGLRREQDARAAIEYCFDHFPAMSWDMWKEEGLYFIGEVTSGHIV